MYCNRLKHFVRINANRTFSVCGHINSSRNFDSYEQLVNSEWINILQEQFASNIWPTECLRCELSEKNNDESIRMHFNKLHAEYCDIDNILCWVVFWIINATVLAKHVVL